MGSYKRMMLFCSWSQNSISCSIPTASIILVKFPSLLLEAVRGHIRTIYQYPYKRTMTDNHGLFFLIHYVGVKCISIDITI